MSMNSMKKISLFTLAAALAINLLSSCGESEEQKKLEQENQAQMDQTPVVKVAPLRKSLFNASLQIPGELIPYQQVDIYAKESSFVKKVFVDVGTEVSEGQLLVSMEAPEINSQIAQAQSRIKSQEAVCLASKANYDRLLETSKTPGTISGNDLDQAAARKNSDEAQLQAAKSALQGVMATKAYLDIRAPFGGIISARNVNPGAYVGPSGKGSDQPLFVLQEQKRLRLVLSVPEAYAGVLKQKDKVIFTVRAMPGKQFTASVNRMAGSLDARLRSERLEMDVTNNNKALLPGMYAEVKLSLPATDSTFVIPKTALVMSTEKVFVIRVTNGKAEWVDVQKGRELNGKVEVYGKLNEGDQLVQAANDEIRDGGAVKTSAAKAEK